MEYWSNVSNQSVISKKLKLRYSLNCKEIALIFKWFRTLKDTFFKGILQMHAVIYQRVDVTELHTGTPALCKISDFCMKTLALNPNSSYPSSPSRPVCVWTKSLCKHISLLPAAMHSKNKHINHSEVFEVETSAGTL